MVRLGLFKAATFLGGVVTPLFLRLSLVEPLTLADLWAFVDVFSEPWNAKERDIIVRSPDGQAVALELAFDASELHEPLPPGCKACQNDDENKGRIAPL